jgi:hypothetical protein
MTLPLPGGPLPDPAVQAKFDEISLKWQTSTQQQSVQAASTQVDFLVPSTAKIAVIEFVLETSALVEFRMFPNNLTTAIYSNIRDGSFETGVPAAAAVAAAGQFNDANGIRLGYAPAGAAAGGQTMSGRAVFFAAIPGAAGQRRVCITQTACSSSIGSNNHAIELQNIAGTITSAAALTSLRFATSAGTMSGLITVTTS